MNQDKPTTTRQLDLTVTETDATKAPCWLLLFLL